MQYSYQDSNDEDDSVVYNREAYTSQENAFIKYITQLDAIPGVVDSDYLKRHYRRVLFSGKIKGLSFISNPKTIRLNSLQRMNMSMEEDAGLDDLADETLFDNIDTCQVTRGTKGNLQYALITQRKEFKDTSDAAERKKSFMGKFMKAREQPGKAEEIEEPY